MASIALLAALLLPTPAQADPTQGVLGHAWGDPVAELAGEPGSHRLTLGGMSYSPRCYKSPPSSDGPLQGSLRSVELCYHDGALFMVELDLSPSRIDLAEDVLRETYGDPLVAESAQAERSRGTHDGRSERSRGSHEHRTGRSTRGHDQTLTWEASEVDIQLQGWSVRYTYQPTVVLIEQSLEAQQSELRDQLRMML